jgi:hypothetical protein
MSGTLMSMTGMGANGGGMSPTMGQLPPGLLQMLMQHAQGNGMGMASQIGGAMPNAPQIVQGGQPPMGGNPQPQMPSQQPPPQQMPGMASAMQGGGLQGLLAMLKGQQTGLKPQGNPGQPPSAFGAGGSLPPWLQAMLGGGAGMPHGIGMIGPGGAMGGGT